MNVNKRKMSKEFEELLEILKSTRMAGDAPFTAYIDRDMAESGGQAGFTCSRHTVCARVEEK